MPQCVGARRCVHVFMLGHLVSLLSLRGCAFSDPFRRRVGDTLYVCCPRVSLPPHKLRQPILVSPAYLACVARSTSSQYRTRALCAFAILSLLSSLDAVPSVSTSVPSINALAALPEERCKLAGCWRRLPQRHRLRVLEGLPEAEKEEIAAVGSGSGGEGRDCEDILGDLVLAPVALCFKVSDVPGVVGGVGGFLPFRGPKQRLGCLP